MSLPNLTPPYTRYVLAHDTTDLFDPETQDALDARYAAGGSIIPDASTTVKGVVELATVAEAEAGTDNTRAVTPDGVAAAAVLAVEAADARAYVNVISASGSTETLSTVYQLHKITMDQNCTFSFNFVSGALDGAVFAVLLSGAFTPTWPGSVDWPDGTLPTYTSPSLYVFATFDSGTTWVGVQSGKAIA